MVWLIVLCSQLLCLSVGLLLNNTTVDSFVWHFVSSLRFLISFSVVSCWSVRSKKTGSSSAMSLDSMIT